MFNLYTLQAHVQIGNAPVAAEEAAPTTMGIWSDTTSQESEVHVRPNTQDADHTGNNEEPSQGLSSTRPLDKVDEVMRMLREERERRCRTVEYPDFPQTSANANTTSNTQMDPTSITRTTVERPSPALIKIMNTFSEMMQRYGTQQPHGDRINADQSQEKPPENEREKEKVRALPLWIMVKEYWQP